MIMDNFVQARRMKILSLNYTLPHKWIQKFKPVLERTVVREITLFFNIGPQTFTWTGTWKHAEECAYAIPWFLLNFITLRFYSYVSVFFLDCTAVVHWKITKVTYFVIIDVLVLMYNWKFWRRVVKCVKLYLTFFQSILGMDIRL